MAVRLVLNFKAFNEIRTSPEVTAELKRRAGNIQAVCGDGYSVLDASGPTRARIHVATETPRAMASNAKHNTLISNLDAGRS